MTAPIYRQDLGSVSPVTIASTASAAYSAASMRIQASAVGNALMCDFAFTATAGGSVTGGSYQLVRVNRDNAGNAGPTPSSTVLPQPVGNFTPTYTTGTPSAQVFTLPSIALSRDADYYVFNNGTGQTVSGTLSAQPWSPGA